MATPQRVSQGPTNDSPIQSTFLDATPTDTRDDLYPPKHHDPLGIGVRQVLPEDTAHVYKELTNKISWALGSTYRNQYHGKTSKVRLAAWELVKKIIRDHGYPKHLERKVTQK